MRREQIGSNNSILKIAYICLIKNYLRFVLIRCLKYTNDMQKAEQFAAYVFITAATLSQKIKGAISIKCLLDIAVGLIGPDFEDKITAHRRITGIEKEHLLDNPDLQILADAINILDALSGKIFVLCHIDKMSVADLAAIFGKPSKQVKFILRQAKKTITVYLVHHQPDWENSDLPILLNKLAESLDGADTVEIIQAVLSCVLDSRHPIKITDLDPYLCWDNFN